MANLNCLLFKDSKDGMEQKVWMNIKRKKLDDIFKNFLIHFELNPKINIIIRESRKRRTKRGYACHSLNN